MDDDDVVGWLPLELGADEDAALGKAAVDDVGLCGFTGPGLRSTFGFREDVGVTASGACSEAVLSVGGGFEDRARMPRQREAGTIDDERAPLETNNGEALGSLRRTTVD